jgi:hypothetical protein
VTILPQLEKNKGTISSKLGKVLAQDVLAGQTGILAEAVDLLSHESKQVRAGAAKIIEQVALGDPSLVVPYLPRLLPALDVDEPQTRWMAIHTLGLCAALATSTALQALPKAEAFIDADSGACLWGSTILFLGYLGATSESNACKALPLLERALKIPGREKDVLRSFVRLMGVAGDQMRSGMAQLAAPYVDSESGVLGKAARQVLKKAGVL